MTEKEFLALAADQRHVGLDGRTYVLRWEDGLGTVLAPVTVVCRRCGRLLAPWPLVRPDSCSPARWVDCIRWPA
jgi:hypothetical protein